MTRGKTKTLFVPFYDGREIESPPKSPCDYYVYSLSS